MDPALVHSILELGAGAFAVIAAAMLLRHYMTRVDKDGKPMGIGIRSIQMVIAVLVAPVVLILALEHVINGETTGTLLGTLLGFILSPKD